MEINMEKLKQWSYQGINGYGSGEGASDIEGALDAFELFGLLKLKLYATSSNQVGQCFS